MARVEWNLTAESLAGFVAEGAVPEWQSHHRRGRRAAACDLQRHARGEGLAAATPKEYLGALPTDSSLGQQSDGEKARILLMASMLKLGSLPPAAARTGRHRLR